MTNKFVNHLIKKAAMEKVAVDPATAILIAKGMAHGMGVHVAQNLALSKAVRTKAVGRYIAKGFHEGASGKVDSSLGQKAREALIGASLPEINNLYSTAHSAGKTLKPHLDTLNLRQKVGLKWAAEGKIDKLERARFDKSETFNRVKDLAMPHLKRIDSSGYAGKAALTSNILPSIARNRYVKEGLKDAGQASHSAASGMLGALSLSAADPITSAINSSKALLDSHRFRGSKVGKKLTEMVNGRLIKKPFYKGVESGRIGKLDYLTSVVATPVPLEAKRLGAASKDVSGKVIKSAE